MKLYERINNTIEYYIKHIVKNRINKFIEEKIKLVRAVILLFALDEKALTNKIHEILNEWFASDWLWFLRSSRLKMLLSTALDEHNAQNNCLITELQTQQNLLLLEKASLLSINSDLRRQIAELSSKCELLGKDAEKVIKLDSILIAKDLEINELKKQNALLSKELTSLKKNISDILAISSSFVK